MVFCVPQNSQTKWWPVLKIIEKREQLTLIPKNVAVMPKPKRILMADPAYFSVDKPINAHMVDGDGKPHILNKNLAKDQWLRLKFIYSRLDHLTYVLSPKKFLPDFVFCANTFFPYIDRAGQRFGIPSHMLDSIRRQEVIHATKFFTRQGYTPLPIETESFFESNGDVLWVPGRRFLLGGYGFRTSRGFYESLGERLGDPIAVFHLTNPLFYHLDTCISILNDTTAIACREAFLPESWELLEHLFPHLWQIPLIEADSPGFACNAHCPDGKHVILQQGNPTTCEILKEGGFIPIEIDTSEFIKSGGSVFCMKCAFW